MHVHYEIRTKRRNLRLRNDSGRFSEMEYLDFCKQNPDLRIERTSQGEISVMPPAGAESSYRSHGVGLQLGEWALRDGRGKVFDSSAQFVLPDGSALSPDAAWVSNAALKRFTRQQRKEFLHLCPEFVVEVMSPSDRLKPAKEKMEQWLSNGAKLAWLIDGDRKTAYVYQAGQPMRVERGASELRGAGPVADFVLNLGPIWVGLG